MYPWGDSRRFNSYSGYFRRTFGTRVQKLSVNAGFSCPNRDGTISTGGCSFCRNDAFTPSYCLPEKPIREQLTEGIGFHANRYRKASQFLAYFQAFSNTHAPLEHLKRIYSEALEVEDVVGIIVGTRPDCVDEQKLDFFAELAQKHYVVVEYGIESCYDHTLLRINRGHDFATAERALAMTTERGIHTGAHFILGLPGETPQMWMEQSAKINALSLENIKFHQLQLFKDTPLCEEWRRNPEEFRFFEVDEYIDLFIDILEQLRPSLVVERFASEAPPAFHAGPNWGMLRNEHLLARFEARLQSRDTYQGRLYQG